MRRRTFRACALVLAMGVLGWTWFSSDVAEAATTKVSVLDNYTPAKGVNFVKAADGMRLTVDGAGEGKFESAADFKTPLVISAKVKTDSTNIRLYFAKGSVIFNWEVNPKELRLHDPKTGAQRGVADAGQVPANTWLTVTWTISNTDSQIAINGEDRATVRGNYKGLSGKVGIGTNAGAVLTVQSFDVEGAAIGDVAPDAPAAVVQSPAAGAAPQPETSGALVIVDAKWGSGTRQADVTNILRSQIKDGRLEAKASNRLLGDPASGSVKQLTLTYDLQGKRTTVTIAEDAAISLGGQTTPSAGTATNSPNSSGAMNTNAGPGSADVSPAPGGLVIVEAMWGSGSRQKDVAKILRDKVKDNRLELTASAQLLGDPTPGTVKQLDLTYDLQGKRTKVTLNENDPIALGGLKAAWAQRLATVRKTQPTGLVVLEAQWGGDTKKDVTDICQGAVSGESLTIPVNAQSFQQPKAWQASLTVTYMDGDIVKTQSVNDGGTLQVGPNITSFLRAGVGIMAVEKAHIEQRAKYGDGLLILNARYFQGDTGVDVSDLLQARVSNGKLAAKVGGAGWPDPVPHQEKQIEVTYWDGVSARAVTLKDNELIDVVAATPPALRAMVPLPDFVPAGRLFSHSFGVAGIYKLQSAPSGVALSAEGRLTWTPPASQVGTQEIRFTLRTGGQEYLQALKTEVVSAETAAAVGGDLAKLRNLMRLDLAGEEHQYVANPDMGGAVLLEKDQITAIAADGISVIRKFKLSKPYIRIAERDAYYVAIRIDPMAMDLLDKKTGQLIKTIKLDYRKFHDLALAPDKAISYVSVEFATTIPRDRIVIVDELGGSVREPKDLLGSYMRIDRSGQYMFVGLHDIYRSGTDYFVNPGFNIVDVPRYGDIDYLLRYDLTAGIPEIKEHLGEVGENGGQIRISPDGRRVTDLTFTGFPAFSKNIAAWDGYDFEKKPVIYDIKNQTGGKGSSDLEYHPILPLVVIPKEDGVMIFGRESGDEEPQRIKIAAEALSGLVVKDAHFSPDGLNVILECQQGEKWFLSRLPLILTDAERALVKKGAPPAWFKKPNAPVTPGVLQS